jgi:uncharacterized protein (DUF58 family)
MVLAVVPTARTAAVLGLIAIATLLVAPGLALAAAGVLLVAAAVDAWAVREPPRIERTLSQVLSRGVDAPVKVLARSIDHRRVLLRQPAMPGIEVYGSDGSGQLAGRLVPRRRGRHELPGVASASVGPLGLARVHHPDGPAVEVRVYPDLVAAQRLIARLRRQLAGHSGGLARGPLGLGTEFESVREYTPGDDIRQLNWLATARLGRPMSSQYRVERDRDVICLLDAGRLMRSPIAGSRTMLDAALDAVALLALAADELGDRCGAIAFDDHVRRAVAPRHLGGRRVIEALFDLEASALDSDFEQAFARVGGSRRALVIAFTDLVDEAAARSALAAIPMLARRHAVVVASTLDSALEELARSRASSIAQLARSLVALDVLEARSRAAAGLRRAGALVIDAPAGKLAERCLGAYLSVKARARL